MARVVVQSLLNHFMDESFGENQSESQNAQDFILKQLGENEVRLLEAENRLAEFKKRNVNLMPGQDGDYFQQLILAKSNTTRLQAITNQVELRRAELLRQLEGEEPSVGIMSSSGGLSAGTIGDSSSANSGQIAQLESQLQNMLLNLTEKHPDVVRIREQIADLRKNDEQEITSQTEATAPLFNRNTLSGSAENELEGNPIYEHMRIELSTSEVQLVTLRAELAEEQKKVAYLSKMVDTIPEVEAELMRLNRDYGVVKSQYETLLSRLESAKLAEDIQQDTKDITFRVIDPPYVPLTPSGPNRQPMIAAMLIIALCAAAGLTFLLNQQRPVFFSARKLRTDTGLPIYGVIGITKANQKIAAHIWFTAGTCGLFALWLLLLVAERQITDAFHIITSRL
jgi:polysaccharide chain length determinant protein (PEP-CTERM system associated)